MQVALVLMKMREVITWERKSSQVCPLAYTPPPSPLSDKLLVQQSVHKLDRTDINWIITDSYSIWLTISNVVVEFLRQQDTT